MEKATNSYIKINGAYYGSFGVSVDTSLITVIPTVVLDMSKSGVLITLDFLCFSAGVMIYSKRCRRDNYNE